MTGVKLTVLAAVAAVLVAGCASTPPQPAATPAASSPAAVASPTYPPGDVTLCAAQIEVGTASGHDYSSDEPHSPDLPQPCRALNRAQLIRAVARALNDMRSQQP